MLRNTHETDGWNAIADDLVEPHATGTEFLTVAVFDESTQNSVLQRNQPNQYGEQHGLTDQ